MTEMSLVKLYCKIISFVLLSNYISVVDPFVAGAPVVISPWAHHHDKLARE